MNATTTAPLFVFNYANPARPTRRLLPVGTKLTGIVLRSQPAWSTVVVDGKEYRAVARFIMDATA